MMGNLISTAFETCGNLSSLCDLVYTFHPFTRRPNLISVMDKMAIVVMKSFQKEYDFVSKEFYRNRMHPPIRYQPEHSGAALWAKHLYSRLSKALKLYQDVCVVIKPTHGILIILIFGY